MTDPIIKEIRETRDRIAARYGYDLDRLADHLERERKHGQIAVSGSVAKAGKRSASGRVPGKRTLTRRVRSVL